MKLKSQLFAAVGCLTFGILSLGFLSSCGSGKIPTPPDTAYLEEFHRVNFEPQEKLLKENELNLFVDYSTCNRLGQNSRFFQEVSASLVNKTTAYYAIKGSQIVKEDLTQNNVYTLLRNIEEVNYAELAKAANQMAKGCSESVMITDGEYYTPSIAKGHENDPYLTDAFKAWILKGYDVHIISEPYEEPYNGEELDKKRFYILFTDDRMPNNIYDRIRRTVDFTKFPKVEEFHISASHPQMKGNGNNSSTQNPVLNSKTQGYGTFEIEDWDGCDWNTIETQIVDAVDPNTGNTLSNGDSIIEMGLDKNSFGCYRIKSVSLKVYDINQEYGDFYNAKVNKAKIGMQNYVLSELPNFMQIDSSEFEKHSKIRICFNKDWFDPTNLSGDPFNYFKIDVAIDDVEPIFEQYEDKFEFESISQPGQKNVSVASSIKQCLADAKVLDKMKGQVIYTVYVKSEKE